jgi:methyl-accepting chemotaxis protein
MNCRHSSAATLLFAVLVLPALAVNAATPRDDVAQVIRLLGYGGGIHQFKNYVLRGHARYREAAAISFDKARTIIDRLSSSAELDAGDKAALDGLGGTVDAYIDALQRVTELRSERLTADLVDRLVLIDDASAVAALEALRARWQWSDFEEMEYQLGYGHAIHDFKNFVLRGQPRYHASALEHLLAVDALIANQLAVEGLGDGDRAALEKLERVVHGYRDYLPLVDKLHAMQRPVQQIDLAVKVNDGPGTTGLAQLRQPGGYLGQAQR